MGLFVRTALISGFAPLFSKSSRGGELPLPTVCVLCSSLAPADLYSVSASNSPWVHIVPSVLYVYGAFIFQYPYSTLNPFIVSPLKGVTFQEVDPKGWVAS